jgi:hypothetical protein
MLRLEIAMTEDFDEEKSEFVAGQVVVLELEHSLESLSKWESKWEIPFLGNQDKTQEQVIDYIRLMNSRGEISPEILAHFTAKTFSDVDAYITAKMTATTFPDKKSRGPQRIITAELIYYWMIALNIPFECQCWHLNKLLTLIQVCNAENAPKKKMSSADARAERQRLNDERRRATGSQG